MGRVSDLLPILLGMAFFGASAILVLYAFLSFFLDRGQEPPSSPGDSDSDGGGGGGPKRGTKPGRPSGGIPLPDAQPARARIRGHERLADLIPAWPRRRSREPQRDPARIA